MNINTLQPTTTLEMSVQIECIIIIINNNLSGVCIC